jgi:hypothetical protein
MAAPDETALWRDAYHIAWVGASNPKGVARTLQAHQATFGADHIAVRAIRGHLDFLQGTSCGPEFDELDAVRDHHNQAEL